MTFPFSRGMRSSSLEGSASKNTPPTLCLELSFDYGSRSHPLFVEAQECLEYSPPLSREREREMIEEMKERLLDKIAELFGIQVLSLLTDEGVYEGGEPGTRVMWHHGSLSMMREVSEP